MGQIGVSDCDQRIMKKSTHKKKSKTTAISKGPPLFSEFGQKAKDLLTKGYSKSQKFSFTSRSEDGIAFTSSATKNGRPSTAAVAGAYRYKDASFSGRIDSDSKITGTLTLSTKFLPSTRTSASFSFLDSKSTKLGVQILQEHAAVSMSVSVNRSPDINFSATVGSSRIALGMEVEYRTGSSCFSKCTAGISMKSLNSDASMILGNKGDSLTASCVRYLDQEKKNAAVVEFTQNLSTKRNTLTVGGSCAVDHQTVVRARLGGAGEFKTVLQYDIRPKSSLAISGEFNTKALDKVPKIGLALSLVL